MNTTLYVDRIEASKILKVSTRTVDRYLRQYKFKVRKNGRRVLIKRKDVDKIIKDHVSKIVDINDDKFEDILPSKKDKVTNLTITDVKVKKPNSIEEQVYKELYAEVKKELTKKQERLEAATYRVGQLEAQTKNMVPLLDFTKKEKALAETKEIMDQRAKKNEELIVKMEAKIRSEKIAKWIYISLIGLLLVAEPILFLLWAFA